MRYIPPRHYGSMVETKFQVCLPAPSNPLPNRCPTRYKSLRTEAQEACTVRSPPTQYNPIAIYAYSRLIDRSRGWPKYVQDVQARYQTKVLPIPRVPTPIRPPINKCIRFVNPYPEKFCRPDAAQPLLAAVTHGRPGNETINSPRAGHEDERPAKNGPISSVQPPTPIL
jgi:hypothetical protein